MTNEESTAMALSAGQQKTVEILARRTIARAHRASVLQKRSSPLKLTIQATGFAEPAVSLQTAGYLVAAGDSWFDYPLHDVLKLLDDEHGYNVESAAHRGDPIEAMFYQDGQLDKFARCVEKVLAYGVTPKAVLLSGGGNDIAGKEFGMLLNNAESKIGGWNSEIVDGLINTRIVTAYKSMLVTINGICQTQFKKVLPVLVHGYDYPVPDGRGFLGGWPFPGPWLEPGFREKLFADTSANVALMRDIIDRFNNMLADLVKDPTFVNVHYLDLRNTLSTDLSGAAYQVWWANELHPTEKGFSAVTDKFANALSKL
jgi:hypothetical protein